MSHIVITGSGGMLGQALTGILKEKGKDFVGLPHSELDITDRNKVLEAFSSLKPSLVIHLAAWTDVDGCERNSKKAFLVNETGTENVVMACAENKANLVYLSTDFVFDGKKRSPYLEDDRPNPINVYGASKLAGEERVKDNLASYFIIRSSWLFGPMASPRRTGRQNFVTKVLSLAREQNPLKIVDDQIGTPTYTRDLGCTVLKLVETSPPGLYHLTNSGSASRYEWAKAILEYSGLGKIEIVPVKHKDFFEIAARPLFSALGTRHPDLDLQHWQDALKDYIKEIGRA